MRLCRTLGHSSLARLPWSPGIIIRQEYGRLHDSTCQPPLSPDALQSQLFVLHINFALGCFVTKKMWLNSDGEGDSDDDDENNAQPAHSVRVGEQQDCRGDPPLATRRSSASQRQSRKVSLDSRPWLLKHSPQWVDFTQRRSSLLSLHFGNRCSTSRDVSSQDPKLQHRGSSVHLHQKNPSPDSRTSVIDQPTTTQEEGGGRETEGSDCDRPRAQTLPCCLDTGESAAVKAKQQQQQLPHHQMSHGAEEKSDTVGASVGPGMWGAALGRHRRASGSWALDNSTNSSSSFSGFSSMSDTTGTNIEVHNFLEESAGSAHEDGGNSSRDGTDSGHARGGKGRRDGRYRRGGVGSADDVRNGDDGRGKDLDAQDVRFLVERKKLRDTLLAVEDLHFSEHT